MTQVQQADRLVDVLESVHGSKREPGDLMMRPTVFADQVVLQPGVHRGPPPLTREPQRGNSVEAAFRRVHIRKRRSTVAGSKPMQPLDRPQYGACVATLDDVAQIAVELPEVTEDERHGHRSWSVSGKAFAWER
ncbi:MAG: hypothetical protein ACXV3C_14165, partial [Actinomycetes bacterium]